ncbi:MAG: hypothetical protein IKX24_11600 [Prevotella sp.]|nr:hypothetical protein [Prevotella sp.]
MTKKLYIKPIIKYAEYIGNHVMIGIGDGTTSMVLGKSNNVFEYEEEGYDQAPNWKNSIWDE